MVKRIAAMLIALLMIATPVLGEETAEYPETVEYSEQGRKNPCPLGKGIWYGHKTNNINFDVILWVESVLRGKEAEEAAKEANTYNSLPGKDEEMFIVIFHAAVTWGEDEDTKLTFSQWDVTGVTAKGRELPDKYLSGTVKGTESELSLYNGGDGTFYGVFFAPKGSNPCVVYEDSLWFALAEEE